MQLEDITNNVLANTNGKYQGEVINYLIRFVIVLLGTLFISKILSERQVRYILEFAGGRT